MTKADAIEWLEWLKKHHTEKWIQEALDIITYCDVIDNCTDCPRYGDDCDGRGDDE